MDLLDPTLSNLKESVVALPPPLIANLGLLYQTKCQRTGAPDDIDNAIRYCERAIEMVTPEHPIAEGASQNLANAHSERYSRTGNRGDLSKAVEYVKKLLSKGQALPQTYLDGGIIMQMSYIATGSEEDLRQSAGWLKQAISLLPLHHFGRPYALYEYGLSLELAYTANPKEDAMADCIDAYKSAIESSRGGQLTGQLAANRHLYKFLLTTGQTNEALPYLESLVSKMAISCPRWLPAGDRQYLLSQLQGISSDAAAALLQVSPSNGYQALRSLELSRGVLLASTMDFRSESKHLASASPELAREWYHLCTEIDPVLHKSSDEGHANRRQEAGKKLAESVGLIRQLPGFGDFSPPLDIGSLKSIELRGASPELFTQYNMFQREYDAIPAEKEGGRQTRKQRELSHKMDALIEKIRSTPGLEDFLLLQTEASVLELASSGAIVVVNSSAILDRSDAIIIQPSGIEVLPLPLLHHHDTTMWGSEQRDILGGWKASNFGQKNKRMRDLLLWLWSSAVKPIIDRLGIRATASGMPPHSIHWILTGALSTLPFHAAGDHTEGSTNNTMSHVVSSYIPTLRALTFAREKFSTKEFGNLKTDSRLLMVTVPNAPGAARLLGVDREAEAIATISKSHAEICHLKAPGPSAVLQELPLANIVHFACHAIPTPSDLSSSHLLLMPDAATTIDQASPGELQRITVGQISARRAPSAELAYLSACSAAENSLRLADEGIHIASAFRMAGFRHVVGTLWRAKDRCCEEVARGFYGELWRLDPGVDGEGLRVPEALHWAVQEVRKRNSERVLEWGCFVHIGG